MCPARHVGDALAEAGVVAAVVVGLQVAAPRAQDPARVRPGSIGREVVECGRGHFLPLPLVVLLLPAGQIDPHAGGDRLAGGLKGQRGVVGEDHRAREHVALQGRHQHREQLGRVEHPVAQRLTREGDALAREDPRLAGQRAVIEILRDHHVGEQPRASVAPGQGRTLGSGGAHGTAAVGALAAVLQAHVLDHFQAGGNVLE